MKKKMNVKRIEHSDCFIYEEMTVVNNTSELTHGAT